MLTTRPEAVAPAARLCRASRSAARRCRRSASRIDRTTRSASRSISITIIATSVPINDSGVTPGVSENNEVGTKARIPTSATRPPFTFLVTVAVTAVPDFLAASRRSQACSLSAHTWDKTGRFLGSSRASTAAGRTWPITAEPENSALGITPVRPSASRTSTSFGETEVTVTSVIFAAGGAAGGAGACATWLIEVAL